MLARTATIVLGTALLAGCTPAPVPGGPFPDGPPQGQQGTPYPPPGPGQSGPYQPGPYQPGPYQPGPYQPGPSGPAAPYRAIGTEPGWTLDIDPRSMRFSGAYGENPITVPTPRVQVGVAGETYGTPRLSVNIVHAPCNDGMSDRSYPDRVQVTADGRQFSGCGGPATMPGMPGTPGGALAESRWRVVSINGQPVPGKGDYHIDFTGDRVSARFGCNGLGARYTLDRDMLSTDSLIGTQMACGPTVMRFESQGSAVLRVPARVRWSPGRATLTNNAGIIELERR